MYKTVIDAVEHLFELRNKIGESGNRTIHYPSGPFVKARLTKRARSTEVSVELRQNPLVKSIECRDGQVSLTMHLNGKLKALHFDGDTIGHPYFVRSGRRAGGGGSNYHILRRGRQVATVTT